MKPEHPNYKHLQDKEPAKPQKELEVRHVLPAEDELEFMKEMSQIAAQKAPPKEVTDTPPIDDSVIQKDLQKRRALESLVLFSQPKTKTVTISGVDFRIKLLNVHENTEVYRKIKDIPSDEQLQKSPIMLLAAALVDANGIDIEENYSGPSEVRDSLSRKYYELCNWNMPIINALVKAYTDFVKEVEKDYTKDFFPTAQKTPSND